jgi:uncharacterized membrane protein YcaP (DUF421 family)
MDAFSVTNEQLVETLGIELWRIPIVIISAITIYLVFLLLVRIFGARVLSGLTGFDIVVGVMLGSVAGRVIIGHPPTVAAGVIGLITLLCCEAIFGVFRNNIRLHRAINARPTVVFAHGQPQPDLMRKTHITFEEIMSCVRKAGHTNLKQVRCVVLEPSGALSVLGYEETMDPEVLHDVLGADRVLDEENVQP